MISGSWVRGERRFTIPRLLPRRLRSLHTLVLVLALLAIGWLGWLWYRGSSFVSVQRVTVARAGAHRLAIHVVEQVPVALVQAGGQAQVVDADGDLLPGTTTHGSLPTVALKDPPDGQSITEPGARAAIAVLAAAPYALLSRVANATSSSAHGVIVQLRNGPQIYFGPTVQLTRKWTAVVAVLQNRDSAGASYIDVSDPSRPAAGAGVSESQATALGLASTAAANSSTAVSSGG